MVYWSGEFTNLGHAVSLDGELTHAISKPKDWQSRKKSRQQAAQEPDDAGSTTSTKPFWAKTE